MFITVAICTWNRQALLERTLESLTHIQCDGSFEWELIVVNNNCTDSTDECLAEFESRLPLRRCFEEQQGHVPSRNRAVKEAKGDFVVWTDDDVIVDPNWLNAYADAFRLHPSASFWGGEIQPSFEVSPPQWLDENWARCEGIYATRNLGDQSFAFDSRRLPFGANFAVKMDCQRDFPFDARFGRVSDQSVRGFDEIDVLRQMLDSGHTGYWVPEARLKHFIPKSRMSIDYVRKYYEGQGETWAIRGERAMSDLHLSIACFTHRCRYACNRLMGRSSKWFDNLVEASRAKGQLRHQRRLRREAEASPEDSHQEVG